MMQYRIDLQELGEILKSHFKAEGQARVDIVFSYAAGRAVAEGGRDLPTIITQITGIDLTVDDSTKTGASRQAPRRKSASPAT
jgi:hypothetical protein